MESCISMLDAVFDNYKFDKFVNLNSQFIQVHNQCKFLNFKVTTRFIVLYFLLVTVRCRSAATTYISHCC